MLCMPDITTDRLGHVYDMCGLNVVYKTLYVVMDDPNCSAMCYIELLQIVVFVFSSSVQCCMNGYSSALLL